MNTHSARVLIQSRQPWSRACALALALLVVGCGTTPRQTFSEATNAPQAHKSEAARGENNVSGAKFVRTAGVVAGAAVGGVIGAAGGAALGAIGGVGACTVTGPMIVLCAPVMAVGGAIAGGVVGGVAGGAGGAALVLKATTPRGETNNSTSTETPVEAKTADESSAETEGAAVELAQH